MFHPPEHSHNLSLRLSSVLDDIGVNEKMVIKRRRAWMLIETMFNIHNKLTDADTSSSIFGSQTEGSTTAGLNSDLDLLLCPGDASVIQHWSDWEPGKEQFLMIQDENTSPGYCLLQVVRSDLPLPAHGPIEEDHTIDNTGRVLLRHTVCLSHIHEGDIRHGPARTGQISNDMDMDCVSALHCSSWPREADPWLWQQNASGWPTDDMMKYSVNQGCFVVPVSSRTGMYPDLEWRISTSYAERCLMYSLNITQMRCYILMKMITNTFLKPICEEAISSFMCKNILFHCIAGSRSSCEWNESSLLTWLNQCLQALLNCILTENCPHFMIPGNNLLAGKLSEAVKHRLVDVMCSLTGDIEQSLLAIKIDDLGSRLCEISGGIPVDYFTAPVEISAKLNITLDTTMFFVAFLQGTVRDIWRNKIQNVVAETLKNYASKMCKLYFVGSVLDQAAISFLAPFICTSIGSMRVSKDIHLYRAISPEALRWFSLGLNSDATSSRLKLASALYCVRELDRCELFLAALRRQLSQTNICSQCNCCAHEETYLEEFGQICDEKNEITVLQQHMALCVTYLPGEYNCIPYELKYEMFRSTEEDRPYRDKSDYWMDWAVVDSLPYLYFLQYKVYSQLHRPVNKQRALENLVTTINNEDNLVHRETALNLLGQCMEQENRNDAALCCYMISLNVRERNNAAKWHVCRLLAGLFQQ